MSTVVSSHVGMKHIAGGRFKMGSERYYPEEAPLREVRVDDFWIDEAPVTNRQFAQFVAATSHVTVAEVAPDPKDYPGLKPEMARAGSLVSVKTAGPVDLTQYQLWWRFVFGADWRHPYGPESSLKGLDDHPVVHIAYGDAEAYARWVGKSLPTEAEFEYAARGGLEGREFAWGDALAPDGKMLANFWQGQFPWQNLCTDGWERTSPVRTFPANGYGIYDMIGNVWEWTQDWWSVPKRKVGEQKSQASCCGVLDNPRGGDLQSSYDPFSPQVRIGRKVLKGGSHLCAVNYCQRFRPAARHPEMIDTSTSHIGFRCVERA